MSTLTLYRAVAYRLEALDTPAHLSQPEVHVFFEVASRMPDITGHLYRLLALAWNCPFEEVEAYNVFSEAELLEHCPLNDSNAPIKAMGDEALLVCGWSNGPLFCRADRTLMLVSPTTLARLQAARRAAVPWHAAQRQADMQAALAARPKAVAQQQNLRERWEAVSVSEMGGLC